MKQGSSNRKVNEQAREVIASILLFEISDPRLELVTITGCEVSYDRSVCNVFYPPAPSRYDDGAAACQTAAGRIRSLMARKLSWRVAPELRFLLDTSVDQAERIASALAADAHRSAVAAPTDSDVPADAVTGTGTNFPGLHISVRNAPGTKCPRCWMHSEQADPETGLCPRCAAVVAAQKAE